MKKQVRKADQAKIRQRKHIAFRMNFLFFSIFILFSLLIFRLGYLQIVKGEVYVRELAKKEEIPVNTSVPRGRLFDRTGMILVDNDPKNAITYTKTTTTKSKDMLDIAEALADLIEQDTKRVTLGDKKDFWILLNSDEAAAKVSKKEILKIQEEKNKVDKDVQREITRLTRDRITDEDLATLTDRDLEILAIYREMTTGYAFSPQVIKNENVTDEEFAAVSERLGELPGVDTITDWDRVKMSTNAILGSTTNPLEGIPKTRLDYFLARDYSRNDRVGRSYFEQYYEDLLRGQKTIVKNVKDRTGRVVETKTVREGVPGKDLMLTIDSELQTAVEEMVSSKLLELKRRSNTKLLDRAFVVMMDPNTGEVLSLVGKRVEQNKETGKWDVLDYTFGTFSTSYEVGSTVKMATMLAGYEHGAARIGEVKIDEPIWLKGALRSKSSVFNRNSRIPMTDLEAIGRSSNVYMFKIAMGIGNTSYVRNSSLKIDFAAFDKMRNSYASLGLGTKTGIDLPGEISGFSSEPNRQEPGKLLDLAIGQFDTYTPLQLAQYVSTIANGGYRIAPKVLKSVYEPSPDGEHFGRLIEETPPKVLNRIANTDQEIQRIKQGMNYTYYGPRGTARGLFQDASFDAGGKTGTAQSTYYDGEDRSLWGTPAISVTHVGFAPFENPEIAYAVVVPHVTTNSSTDVYPNNELAKSAVMKYFEIKEKRKNEEYSTEMTIKPAFEAEKKSK